jgi:hypothetical protein
MCFYVSVVAAAVFALLGFGALYVADRTTEAVQGVARLLGIWLFVLALFPLAGGVYFSVSGTCTLGDDKRGQRIHEQWERDRADEMGDLMPGAPQIPEYRE